MSEIGERDPFVDNGCHKLIKILEMDPIMQNIFVLRVAIDLGKGDCLCSDATELYSFLLFVFYY
jgi:hypothetical protein